MKVRTVSELANCQADCTCHGMAHEAAMDTARRQAWGYSVNRQISPTVSRIEAARQNMPEVDYLALVATAVAACQS